MTRSDPHPWRFACPLHGCVVRPRYDHNSRISHFDCNGRTDEAGKQYHQSLIARDRKTGEIVTAPLTVTD